MTAIRKIGWMAAVLVRVALIGIGIAFVALGVDAKDRLRTAMVAEDIYTGKDAAIPNALIANAATAEAQEALLTEHTLGRFGPYSGMDREDPNRETYLTALTMRNALNLSVMGFGVSDLAIGTGAVVILLGASTALFMAPALYTLRRPTAAA
jgi:hypothetical protein